MSEERIYRYVARVGSLGWLGGFGSISWVDALRDEEIVVATSRGIFLATVIERDEAIANQSSSPRKESSVRLPLVGEVIRKATQADLESSETYRRWCQAEFEQITQTVSLHCSSIAVTDLELTIDGKQILIWFIGQSSSALGPLTLELASHYALESVQFVPVENATPYHTTLDLPSPSLAEESPIVHPWSQVLIESRNSLARFSKEASTQLQYHGIYQQKLRPSQVSPTRNWSNPLGAMIRIRRNPFGWTLSQINKLMQIAGRFGDGWLRPTLRQGWQIYGISKKDIPNAIKELDSLLLTSFGACGNGVRSVTCCPLHSYGLLKQRWAFETAVALEQLLRPKDELYEILWLENESSPELPTEDSQLLPHKFKIAVATDEDYCTEPRANDIGVVISAATPDDNKQNLLGQIFLGGGLGFRLNDPSTSAQLGEYCCTVAASDILPLCSGIVAAYRKYGPRRQRRKARFKYWLNEIGKQAVLRLSLAEASRLIQIVDQRIEDRVPERTDHTGWHLINQQGFLGMRWNQGGFNAADRELNAVLRDLKEPLFQRWHLTSGQEVVFGPMALEQKGRVGEILAAAPLQQYLQVPQYLAEGSPEKEINYRGLFIACPALPTCSQALSESETYRPELQRVLDSISSQLAIPLGKLQVRISGCSNNCSRPTLAHIGLIAHSADCYVIYVGGSVRQSLLATRLDGSWNWGPELQTALLQICRWVQTTARSRDSFASLESTLADCFESLSPEQWASIHSQISIAS